MKIARVFPRKTNATPVDNLAFIGMPPPWKVEVDEIHISVTFTYDLKHVDYLERAWSKIAPVKIGGPAFDDPGSEFTPGLYLKPGYVITSRGCPNKCWFCDVPRREGKIRQLEIKQGHNLLDSNILACSYSHVEEVFEMLKNQPKRVQLTGGLEAARLTDWHIDRLHYLRPKQFFFAYDTPDDLEPLIIAGKKLKLAGFTNNQMRCYVLIGYPNDTMCLAEKRLIDAWKAGFMPMAMLWKNKNGDTDKAWLKLQRTFARPAITRSYLKVNII